MKKTKEILREINERDHLEIYYSELASYHEELDREWTNSQQELRENI